MKRTLLIGSIVLGLAGIGALTSVAMAQDATPTPAPASTPSTFVQNLAEELGLDVGTVQSAVQEARQAAQRQKLDEIVAARLAAAVEKGHLTQAEADEITTWWQSRPEAANKIPLLGFGPKRGHHHGHMGPLHKGLMPPGPAPAGQ